MILSKNFKKYVIMVLMASPICVKGSEKEFSSKELKEKYNTCQQKLRKGKAQEKSDRRKFLQIARKLQECKGAEPADIREEYQALKDSIFHNASLVGECVEQEREVGSIIRTEEAFNALTWNDLAGGETQAEKAKKEEAAVKKREKRLRQKEKKAAAQTADAIASLTLEDNN